MSRSASLSNPSRLAGLLAISPLGERASLLMDALSFRPNKTLSQSFRVGPVRAAFADFWQEKVCTIVPIRDLREVLDPPVCVGTVLEFNRFDYLQHAGEIESQLAALLEHLKSRLARLNADRQILLFEELSEVRPAAPRSIGTTVQNLSQLTQSGRKFPTIYADPPWPYENETSRAAAVNHYPVMSLDAIRNEPISQLAAKDSHLHLWTTNAFLRNAFDVITAWGFTFKSCFVWVKSDIGMGNYLRVSHEFLLLGVRGNLTFRDRTLASWMLADRTFHSRKPGRVRSLIERVSPGPYLELYGREELPDSEWTVYGNQIEKRLY